MKRVFAFAALVLGASAFNAASFAGAGVRSIKLVPIKSINTAVTMIAAKRHGSALPGPIELPGLGAPQFLLDNVILQNPLAPILIDYRCRYGDIFTIKTGPVRQVWVCDEAMVSEMMAMDECSGRSQLPDGNTPFGKNFLFLTRDPLRAKPIRQQQRQWLAANAGDKEVRAAVQSIELELFSAIDDAMACGTCKGAAWPAEQVSTALLGALLGVFAGEQIASSVSMGERSELLSCLSGYRTGRESQMRVGFGAAAKRQTAPPNPLATKPRTKLDYANQVRSMLLDVLGRSGRTAAACEEFLPLLVSACAGGGELFPILLQWIVRRLALEPELQATIRQELTKSGQPYGATLPRVLSEALRQCPYSLAVGPPRKVLATFDFRGFQVPEGSLVFTMHPGVGRNGPLPPLDKATADTKGKERAMNMFGAGARSCTSAETSLGILSSALAALIGRYEITIADAAVNEELLMRYKSDDAFLLPEVEVPLAFRVIAKTSE